MAPARTVPNPCPLLAATRLAPWPPASGTPADSKVPRCTVGATSMGRRVLRRSEEHTSELQSRRDLVCRLLLEKKKGSGGYRFFKIRLLGRSATPHSYC